MTLSRVGHPGIGHLLVILLAWAPAAGCHDEPAPGPPSSSTFRTWDSAGITVAESVSPAWTEETRWSIPAEPILQIGAGEEGDPDVQFAYITGVHRLAEGTIAVVDAWTPGIHFFDSLGTHVGRGGREGSGPGEFPPRTVPNSFTCGADTVYVQARQQVSAFIPPGTHVRSFSLDPPTRVHGCYMGRLVGEQSWGEWRTTPGTFTDSVRLVWYDRRGERLEVIDTLPREDRNWRGSGPEGIGYMPKLFGDALAVAAHPGGFATGFSNTFRIQVRDGEGAVRRVYRASRIRESVTAADADRFRGFVFNPWRGNDTEQRALEEELVASEGQPRPAFAELKWDSRGNLWVRQHDHLDAIEYFDWSARIRSSDVPMLDEPRRWMVFDSTGAWLGQVETPARFVVHDIGDRRLVGVWRDHLEIPYARVYPIVKP